MAEGQMWFGTEDWMQWIPSPLSGATMNPEAWNASGTLANGGGYALSSWGSHKLYVFEWSAASSRQAAQLMKSYADGLYGRGLVYFVNPLSYNTNVLPARLAAPYMTVGSEGSSLVYDIEPIAVLNSGWQQNALPSNAAQYDLTTAAVGYRGIEDSTFIPIPEGYQLHIGGFYSATGSGGIFYTPVSASGADGTAATITPLSNGSTTIIGDSVPSGARGVRIWLGKTASGAATVTVSALIARLYPIGTPPETMGPWVGGDGHSGCRFDGKPTYQAHNAVGGGQIGYAVTLREVGSWAFG